jgi:hemerythrin superfamily protein
VADHDGQRDVIAVLVHDHREVEEMFRELEANPGDAERRREIVDNVIRELVRHSVAEEMYLYPAAREHIPDGDEIVEHEIAEHAEAERTMKNLEKAEAGTPEFDRLVGELIAEIRHHLDEEEGKLFPRLAESCDADTLRSLGADVERAKKLAPTHPHPNAPDHPPLNKLLGPGLGFVDRLRDALSKR